MGAIPATGRARGLAGPAARSALPAARDPHGEDRRRGRDASGPAQVRRLGYDGKGQRLVKTRVAGTVPGHVLEERVAFDREALAPRRPRPRRRHALLPAGRERTRGRDPATLIARRTRRRAQAEAGGVPRAPPCELGYIGVLARALRGRWPLLANRWRAASTTRATGRSRAPRRASSRTTSAQSSGCRSAPPSRALGCSST